MNRTKAFLSFLVLLVLASSASASSKAGVEACEGLAPPFDALSKMGLAASVANPPRLQLCHRVANAERHFRMERINKSIAELEKYIVAVGRTGSHPDESYVAVLTAEAERVISIVSGQQSTHAAIAGVVYDFYTNKPVPAASVAASFVVSDTIHTMITAQDGSFSFEGVPPSGAFLVDVTDALGAVGTAQGSLLPGDKQASVFIYVAQPGGGTIKGQVSAEQDNQSGPIVVSAVFPDSNREYTTVADPEGHYQIEGVRPDGTVIVVAFDAGSGASASYSSVVSGHYPIVTIDLELVVPTTIHATPTNGQFKEGLAGWVYSGPIRLVNTGLVFETHD